MGIWGGFQIGMRISIEALADRAALVGLVAEWHWEEWGHVDPDGSLESWTDSLARRINKDRIPAGYVGLVDQEPVGSVFLVEHDMPGRDDLAQCAPWLAGLFVLPEHRRHGIGSALVEHAEAQALEFGLERLFAYTSQALGLYRRLGWVPMMETVYERQQVVVIAKELM